MFICAPSQQNSFPAYAIEFVPSGEQFIRIVSEFAPLTGVCIKEIVPDAAPAVSASIAAHENVPELTAFKNFDVGWSSVVLIARSEVMCHTCRAPSGCFDNYI